jgi:hypothetical protein
MKKFLVLVVLFFAGFFSIAIAQDKPSLKRVHLNEEDALLAMQAQIVLIPGDTLQFVTDKGEFAIFIQDAVNFLKIRDTNLKVHINKSTNPESDMFIVRDVKAESDIKVVYSIYCISNDSWPLAPPRIIIKVN